MLTNRNCLFFIIYWIIYSGLIQIYVFNSEFIGVVPDAVLIFMLCRGGVSQKNVPLIRFLGKPVLYATSLFFAIGVLSSFLNRIPIVSFLWGLRLILRYVILFYYVFITFSKEDILSFKDIILHAMNYNIYVCLFQSLVLGVKGDSLGGTFYGGNANILMLMMLSLFFLLGDYFQKKTTKRTVFKYIAGMYYIAILGEIKFLYFTIPLFTYFVYVFLIRFGLKHVIIVMLSLFLFVPVSKSILSLYYSESYVNMVFDADFIENETTQEAKDGNVNRSTALSLTTERILQSPFYVLFGYGLGNSSGSSTFKTWVFDAYSYTIYNWYTTSYLLVEVGWIGFILFCLIFVSLFLRFYSFFTTTSDSILRYWAMSGTMCILLICLHIWYNNKPIYDGYIFYFYLSVCLLAVYYRINELRKEKVNSVLE